MSDKRDAGIAAQDTMIADSATAAQTATAPAAPLVGGRYEVLSLLGSGAMGSVYRVRDVELDEIVALKFLRAELSESAVMLERFRREVKLARRVTHVNVARVFDIGEHEDRRKYLTMEFIDGEPLGALMARNGALPPARALAIAHPICQGLEAAHAVGVVHRDLKPDNVMLAADGRVVITDFGIARSAALSAGPGATIGGIVGTPAYMAPEQVEASPNVDHRADIYALGVMLFEMMTGDLPFQGSSPITMASARLIQPAPDMRSLRPELPGTLSEIVARCMAKDPAMRFQSAAEVSAALSAVITMVSLPPPVRAQSIGLPAPPRADQTVSGDKTIAVLPFKNLGPADDAYLALGLSDDLTDTLSMVSGLRVRPHALVARVAKEDADPQDLGRQLDVQVIVDGSIRRRGEMLRVSARALSVTDGFQLWARRFDRPEGDALVVSDEVADAVAQALTVAPVAQQRHAPTDPVAVDLYLKGRSKLRSMSGELLSEACELLRQAHERAPDDTTILAAYARAQARVWFFDAGADPVETARRTLELAEHAVAAAPDRGEALVALAHVRFVRTEYEQAADLTRRALERAPLLAHAHELAGRILLEAGPLDAGIATMERAHQLDPLDEGPVLELTRAYALHGDFARVGRFLDSTQAAHGPVSRGALLSRLALWSDQPELWLSRLPPIESAPDYSPLQLVIAARTVVASGKVPPAIEQFVLNALAQKDRPARFRALLSQIGAELHAYAKNPERALDFIERACEFGLIDLCWLEKCPLFADLSGMPRFSAVRERLRERVQPIRAALGHF